MILVHICEVCGVTETMDSEKAFQDGWDYPPRMGEFGTVSPRTCGECGIQGTLYFRILLHEKSGTDGPYKVTPEDLVVLERIQSEPESILPKEPDDDDDVHE